jgi:hypothetical protein
VLTHLVLFLRDQLNIIKVEISIVCCTALLSGCIEGTGSTVDTDRDLALHVIISGKGVCSSEGSVSTWAQAGARNSRVATIFNANEDIALGVILEAAGILAAETENLDSNVDFVNTLGADGDPLGQGSSNVVGV